MEIENGLLQHREGSGPLTEREREREKERVKQKEKEEKEREGEVERRNLRKRYTTEKSIKKKITKAADEVKAAPLTLSIPEGII